MINNTNRADLFKNIIIKFFNMSQKPNELKNTYCDRHLLNFYRCSLKISVFKYCNLNIAKNKIKALWIFTIFAFNYSVCCAFASLAIKLIIV